MAARAGCHRRRCSGSGPPGAAAASRRGVQALKRSALRVPDLLDAIQNYHAAHNENLEPFQWTSTTEQILEKVRRQRVTVDAIANVNRDADLVGLGATLAGR
jgi:hypothetical protein